MCVQKWIIKCLEDIFKSTWVIPAIRMIREISALFPANKIPGSTALNRADFWRGLNQRYGIKKLILDSFTAYMIKARDVRRVALFTSAHHASSSSPRSRATWTR